MTTTSKKLVPNKRFPEFENSGEWEEKKLEDIVDILDNLRRPISKNNRIPGQYPYYGANGIMDYINDYIFDGTYILLGEDGSVINQDSSPVMHIAIGKFWVNNHAHVVKEKCQLYNLYFIYYALHNANIEGLVKGIPPKLNQENLKTINITIADVKEQQKIADFMSSVDKLIELEQKKLEKLKEYKKGLLQSIFESNGQDKCIIDRFNCSSDILKNLSIIIMGASPAKEKANTEFGIEFHQGKSFFDYLYIKDSKKYTTDYSKKINEDYIIISVRAPVGEINLTDREIALGRGLCGIEPFKVNKLYLYYYLLYFKNLINYNAKGLVFDSITKSDVENIYIKFPPDTIQENIGNTLFFLDKIIIEQINKVEKIQEYKKGLLQQLFPN